MNSPHQSAIQRCQVQGCCPQPPSYALGAGGTDALSASAAHPEVVELCSLIQAQDMYVGLTLKPETPVELLFPYVDAGIIDMVSALS